MRGIHGKASCLAWTTRVSWPALTQGYHVARALVRFSSTLLLGAVLLAASCKSSSTAEQQAGAAAAQGVHDGGAGRATGDAAAGSAAAAGGQWYRAVFVGGEGVGEIPFHLYVPAPGSEGTAILATGSQHVEASCRWYGSEATLSLPMLRTRIFLRRGEDRTLHGHMMTHSPVIEGRVSLPMRATPVLAQDETRLFPDAGPCARPAEGGEGARVSPIGAWLASFDALGAANLLMEEEPPGVVSASFRFRNGSVVYMTGNRFDGGCVRLSGFDGVNPFLATVEIDPETQGLRGSWVAGPGLDLRDAFTADRREGVNVASSGVRFVPNRTPLRLFELGLPQYRGKPVIIEFGASWCPPCLDEVPLLRELYAEHHDEGLEIVTLLFELLDDDEQLLRQAKLFVEELEIPWQVVPVRGAITPYWDVVPHDSLTAEVNLPVTLFINADGTIRDADMGFPAPSTGAPYQEAAARYRRLARELVAGQ